MQRIYIQRRYQGKSVYYSFKDMVIVRLGLTDESQFDINEVLKGILGLKVGFRMNYVRTVLWLFCRCGWIILMMVPY
jgi:hypothetical protein